MLSFLKKIFGAKSSDTPAQAPYKVETPVEPVAPVAKTEDTPVEKPVTKKAAATKPNAPRKPRAPKA
jgi:hypothetical protein